MAHFLRKILFWFPFYFDIFNGCRFVWASPSLLCHRIANFNEILLIWEERLPFLMRLELRVRSWWPQAVPVTRMNHYWSWKSSRFLWMSLLSMIERGDTCWCHAGVRFASHFFCLLCHTCLLLASPWLQSLKIEFLIKQFATEVTNVIKYLPLLN